MLRRKQAVIFEKPNEIPTYANMVRDVKAAVRAENIVYDIRIRKTKSGNMILEIQNKEEADKLADLLRHIMTETVKIRRPTPIITLMFIGIEDSVESEEPQKHISGFRRKP